MMNVSKWRGIFERIYDELQAFRMLQRDPCEILERAAAHLAGRMDSLPPAERMLHLVKILLLRAIALDDEIMSPAGRRLAASMRAALWDYVDNKDSSQWRVACLAGRLT